MGQGLGVGRPMGLGRPWLIAPVSSCRPTQASSPSWWKISVRASPWPPDPGCAGGPALRPRPWAWGCPCRLLFKKFFSPLTEGVRGVQVEEIYDLQSKCQG